MKTIPFLWTNDDISFGQTEQHRRQLEFLDRYGIPGVFFMIPGGDEGKTLADDTELLRLIESSRARGHEYYQHGYIHTPYESGVPELSMLDFSPEVKRQYDERRAEIEASHTFEALTEKIEKGRKIWRRAFYEDSPGYRPGWGAFCTNLYRALEALQFDWVSSRLPSLTSWLWNLGRWDEPMNYRAAVEARPHRIGKLWEFPIGGDYGFRVPNEPARIEAMVGLGLQEFDYCHERDIPFLLVSHWHGLERNGGTGYAVHEKLLGQLIQSGKAEPICMSELARRTSSVAS
jgi:peptidoglycan/xylan/chitin deacetylase (PgdA/CDA1 family)